MATNVHNHDDGQSNVICKICRRQLSRYTCPSCNIPYCSLICFRSPVHSDCSETFYKKEIQNGINTQPAKSAKERLMMMEMLKRFEESSLEDENLLDDEDDEGENDLANRFEGVDLENTAYEDIWDKLTGDEKIRFLKAVENPESDLGKDLLAHSRQEFIPWWESHRNEDEDPECQMPEPMKIPSTMVRTTPIPTGPPLIYNLCAICIAYVYATRYFEVSPLSTAPEKDVREKISKLVPFLADRKSTMLHTSLDSLVVDIWSRFDADTISKFSILLNDAAQLIRTRPPIAVVSGITSVEPGHVNYGSHPNRDLILALSDLHHVYSCIKHISHKLLFYAAYVLSTPPAVFHSLAVNLEDRSKELGKTENELRNTSKTERIGPKNVDRITSDSDQATPLIVEL